MFPLWAPTQLPVCLEIMFSRRPACERPEARSSNPSRRSSPPTMLMLPCSCPVPASILAGPARLLPSNPRARARAADGRCPGGLARAGLLRRTRWRGSSHRRFWRFGVNLPSGRPASPPISSCSACGNDAGALPESGNGAIAIVNSGQCNFIPLQVTSVSSPIIRASVASKCVLPLRCRFRQSD